MTSTDVMTVFCECRREAGQAGAQCRPCAAPLLFHDKSTWNCDESCQNTIEQVSMYTFFLSGKRQGNLDWNSFVQHAVMMTMTIATHER